MAFPEASLWAILDQVSDGDLRTLSQVSRHFQRQSQEAYRRRLAALGITQFRDNPDQLYRWLQDCLLDLNTRGLDCLERAVENREDQVVAYLTETFADRFLKLELVLNELAKGNYLDLIKIILTRFRGAEIEIHWAMGKAAERGYLELMKYFISLVRDPQELVFPLEDATEHGQLEIIKILLDHGAPGLDGSLGLSARRGYQPIVEELLRRGGNPNIALRAAASGGQLKLVQLLIDQATNPETVLTGAIERVTKIGNPRILNFVLDRGLGTPNQALLIAASRNAPRVISHLLKRGANNLQEALLTAASEGSSIHFILELLRLAGDRLETQTLVRALEILRNRGKEEMDFARNEILSVLEGRRVG